MPSYLSELATSLLNPNVEPPTADQLSLDLGRLDTESNDEFYGEGPLGFAAMGATRDQRPTGRSGRKLIIGAVALLVIAAGGVLLARNIGGGNAQAANAPNGNTSTLNATTPTPTPISGNASQVKLGPDSVRIIETKGDGSELANAAKMVDNDTTTYWKSSWYSTPGFGHLKNGIGVLIDLGSVRDVTSVAVAFQTPNATVQAYIGDTDPGLGNANSAKLVKAFKAVGTAGPQVAGPSIVLPIGQSTRYVLIWVSVLPPGGDLAPAGRYLVGIDEVSVVAR